MFSGFVVSLIALPLALGLAMASDAPPISGVIAAIVGGVVMAILGGSHVTIAGPGNGLVGVILVAISSLGLESAYVAIMCSGVLLMLLGFFRMGTLADFFSFFSHSRYASGYRFNYFGKTVSYYASP